MRVALFITCFNDLLYPEVGRATVRLLRRLGVDVAFPQEQTCCGQMHFNTGYRDACVPLVERFTRAFSGFDAVVTPSASCAAMVRGHHAIVAAEAGDARLERAVGEVAPRVHELTEFLVDVLGVEDVGAEFRERVAYHPTCHSLRLLRVGDRPQRLLRAVRGRTLIELFAWLGDALLYRANLIPERQRLAFLRLLGQPLQPARPVPASSPPPTPRACSTSAD